MDPVVETVVDYHFKEKNVILAAILSHVVGPKYNVRILKEEKKKVLFGPTTPVITECVCLLLATKGVVCRRDQYPKY